MISVLILTKAELQDLSQLKKDRTRIVLTADKDVAMVVMDMKEYIEKATNLLLQPVYRAIDKNPTTNSRPNLLLSSGS